MSQTDLGGVGGGGLFDYLRFLLDSFPFCQYIKHGTKTAFCSVLEETNLQVIVTFSSFRTSATTKCIFRKGFCNPYANQLYFSRKGTIVYTGYFTNLCLLTADYVTCLVAFSF